jgi:hypothetical protein
MNRTRPLRWVIFILILLCFALAAYRFNNMFPNRFFWSDKKLIECLATGDETAVKKPQLLAAMSLVERGRDVVPNIIEVLDSNETSRYFGAMALGDIGDNRAREPLASILKRDGEMPTESTYQTAIALAKLEDLRGLDYLKEYVAMKGTNDTYVIGIIKKYAPQNDSAN